MVHFLFERFLNTKIITKKKISLNKKSNILYNENNHLPIISSFSHQVVNINHDSSNTNWLDEESQQEDRNNNEIENDEKGKAD